MIVALLDAHCDNCQATIYDKSKTGHRAKQQTKYLILLFSLLKARNKKTVKQMFEKESVKEIFLFS